MQARDPKPERPAGATGRPAFGLGPIARVSAHRPPVEPSRPVPPPQYRPAPGPSRRVAPGSVGVTERFGAAPESAGAFPGATERRGPGDRVGYPALPPAGRGFGLPNLRRNVCPHFYMTGSRGAIPIQAPHLLKALIRQDANVSRCQLRGGVHLEQGYVNDVCLTPRFNQCVFYEDDLTKS